MKTGGFVKVLVLCATLVAGLGISAKAFGQGAKKPGRVITLSEVTIVGRVQRPIAAVDVARIRPRITLSETHHPFIERIEQAITKDPF